MGKSHHSQEAWSFRTLRGGRADRSRVRERDMHDEFHREVEEALDALLRRPVGNTTGDDNAA